MIWESWESIVDELRQAVDDLDDGTFPAGSPEANLITNIRATIAAWDEGRQDMNDAGSEHTCAICGERIRTPALTPTPGVAIIDLDANWNAVQGHYEEKHPGAELPGGAL